MLAGYTRPKHLADEIKRRGLARRGMGEDKITGMESPTNTDPYDPKDLRIIAEACDLTVEWFYVDIRAALIATRRGDGGLPQSELQRRLRGDEPSPPDPPEPGTGPEEDTPPGSGG